MNAKQYEVTRQQRDAMLNCVNELAMCYPDPPFPIRLSMRSAQEIADELTGEMEEYEEQQQPIIEEAIEDLLKTNNFIPPILIVDYLQTVKRIDMPYWLVYDYVEQRGKQ